MKDVNKKEELHDYVLIDYGKPPPFLPQKEVKLTVDEAHDRNQGYSLNGVTFRYVRKDHRF